MFNKFLLLISNKINIYRYNPYKQKLFWILTDFYLFFKDLFL